MPNQILDALMQALSKPSAFGPAGQMVDLGRIVVNPNQQAKSMAQPAPQAQPQMTPPPATMQQPQSTGPSPVMEFLRQMGIPLASAAVGLASPQMLPGAAGMATGFAGEMSKEREYEKKLAIAKEGVPTYTFNPDSGQYEDTGVRVPKNAKISRLTSDQQNKLQEALDKIILGDSKGTEQIAQETRQKFNLGDAPEAGKYKDGAVLKDESGNPIAINKGGSWQSIQ